MHDTPLSPPEAAGFGGGQLPAYLSNGVIGLRVTAVPLTAGMTLISGYTGEHPVRLIEAAAPAPYPLAADIALDGMWYSDSPQMAADPRQSYDFATGELTSRFTLRARDHVARVEVVTFCSRVDPSLVCQEIAVEVDAACELGLKAVVDAAGIEGRAVEARRTTPGMPEPAADACLLWESRGGLSRCGLALATALLGAGEVTPERPPLEGARLASVWRCRAHPGRRLRLRQIVSLVPDALHRRPDQQAVRLVARAADAGFERLRRENRAAWADLWRGRVVLEGADERWQALADAAFFYLNTSVHSGSPASTSIFGLATWRDYHYYHGHVMWDIEAFAVPPLSVQQPHAARALLDYRFAALEGARRNARLNGRRGLQFPWESAPGTGEEATPLPGTSSWREDHVSLDVARAFAVHADTTGDLEFLRARAWPVLSGVAEWLTSRVTPGRHGYAIRDSMGIAERRSAVDNPAFTTMAAVVVLRAAAAAAERLGFAADPLWPRIADRMDIPRRGEAVVSHDGYRADEEKGATPDPLMGLFPFGYPLAPAAEQATLAFYLSSAQAYIGSPMLSALYGAWAARAGDRRLALTLLDEGYGQFCVDRFLQTLEYRADRFPEQPRAGPFFANIGGFLTSLLFGFTGLEPGPDGIDAWARRPVNLPAGWRSISVDRLWIRGQPMRLTANQGDAAVLTGR